ncbi:cell division protein FtsA [Alkalicoccus chagannorensis]|uniref:cell division protein FtsA n=1 Tax=Alkalicoccus chagannorensis TaxID=427072 RepID=UPI000479AD68|nr:cell division protein FtsA [Alkalicoccus chagannorensis]
MNQEHTYAALDVGTSSVRIVVGEVASGALNIIGAGEVPSSGLKKGAIVDIDDTVQSIRKAVEKGEQMLGTKITSVIVGITGNSIELQSCNGIVAVSSDDKEIREEDIHRVLDAAKVVSIPPDREIVDVIPSQFIVDGLEEIHDPRGMIGVRLEMQGTLITGSKTVLHNLYRCVEKAGLEPSEGVLLPLGAGSIALSDDEKALGTAVMDIGGGTTTVSVFENGVLKAVRQLPVGGEHITNDISLGMRISTEKAEGIKKQEGHALMDDASDDELFEVPKIGSEELQEFSQWQLAGIIEPRAEEIYTMAAKEIYRAGFNDLPGGIVLTGGTMNMPGMLELAREIFENNIRTSIPDYIGVRGPEYTNSIGALTFAYRNAKIQGKSLQHALEGRPGRADPQPVPEKSREKRNRPEPAGSEGPGMKQKVSKFFKSFLE